MDSFVPYREIIFNPVILTVWFNSLADIGSGIFLLTYVPTYINNVLHYGIAHTGWLGALPAISHIPIKLGVGYLSDHVKLVISISVSDFGGMSVSESTPGKNWTPNS